MHYTSQHSVEDQQINGIKSDFQEKRAETTNNELKLMFHKQSKSEADISRNYYHSQIG